MTLESLANLIFSKSITSISQSKIELVIIMFGNSCGFCGGGIGSNERCVNCDAIWPKNKIKNFEFSESFTDYSYNRYDGVMGKIFKTWNVINANSFVGRNVIWRLAGKLFAPLMGARPTINWPEPSSILDVGCGRCAFLKQLPNSWLRSGTDIVNYNSDLDVVVGPFEAVQINNKFDIVRSWHSLEHSYLPNLFLKKLEDLVDDDGVLVISTPNSESLSAIIFRSDWLPYKVETHYWLPSKKAS